MQEKLKVLLIIPCYNEEASILNVYEDMKPVLKYCDFVFINDGSKDNSSKILKENNLNHIDLVVNLGLSGAVQMGYKYAYENGYDAAVQFDGDGQHQSSYISKLIDAIKEGNDIVIGSRFVNGKKPWSARMIGSRMISLLIKVTTGKVVKDPTSGMRILNRKMIYDYAYNMNRKPEPDTLAYQIRKGAKVKEVQVEMNERESGESYLNPWNSIKYMIKTLISIIFFMY